MHHQDNNDEGHLDDGGRQLQDDHAYYGLDGVAATLEHASQSARLALEMEAQREFVHVHKGAIGKPPHGMHGHLGEQRIA